MVESSPRENEPREAKPLRRILLADDEPDILRIARISLEMVGGYEVATCFSGSELLERLPDFKPDLVITDVVMPDMAGLEVLEALRRIDGCESLPVVFFTGIGPADELEKLRQAGAVEIILKPFDPMKFSDRVAEIWRSCHER
jgi:CheY-like chemotaxis protein